MSIDDSKFFHVHHFQTTKEIWDTLKMIYGFSLSIKQKEMNTRGEEGEDTTLRCFSKFKKY